MKEYENILKGLMKAVRMTKDAALATQLLEDKLRFTRASNELGRVLDMARKQYYEVKDALNNEYFKGYIKDMKARGIIWSKKI